MDIEEFISCVVINQQVIDSLRIAWQNRTQMDEIVHSKIMELLRLCLLVVGMPAAVSKYIETNNLQEVMSVQTDIIKLYKHDISQYDSNNKLSIEEIFFQSYIGLLAAQ